VVVLGVFDGRVSCCGSLACVWFVLQDIKMPSGLVLVAILPFFETVLPAEVAIGCSPMSEVRNTI